jgi:hypothetical protein
VQWYKGSSQNYWGGETKEQTCLVAPSHYPCLVSYHYPFIYADAKNIEKWTVEQEKLTSSRRNLFCLLWPRVKRCMEVLTASVVWPIAWPFEGHSSLPTSCSEHAQCTLPFFQCCPWWSSSSPPPPPQQLSFHVPVHFSVSSDSLSTSHGKDWSHVHVFGLCCNVNINQKQCVSRKNLKSVVKFILKILFFLKILHSNRKPYCLFTFLPLIHNTCNPLNLTSNCHGKFAYRYMYNFLSPAQKWYNPSQFYLFQFEVNKVSKFYPYFHWLVFILWAIDCGHFPQRAGLLYIQESWSVYKTGMGFVFCNGKCLGCWPLIRCT